MRGALPVAVLVTAMLSGCTAAAESAEDTTPSPFAACGLPSGAVPAPSGATAAASSDPAELPDIAVDCFTGGAAVHLRDLRGPAVINIWASYCGPCREELPVVQKLADTGKLTVFGLDTGDGRSAAASFGADHGVTMPTLYDPDRVAITALRVVNLPSTIFVSADGTVYTHRYAMDAAELTELVAKHTGITVKL